MFPSNLPFQDIMLHSKYALLVTLENFLRMY
jgi:hypothetical protein